MDVAERLRVLSDRVPSIVDHLTTEEATKNSLVMPFLQALGYDIFNPREIMPEFTADVGIKRGEKVDYAILHDGKPAVLIECKRLGSPLDAHGSQLFRYFGTTTARVAILTNGIEYRFFSDLAAPNRMDERPFLTMRIDRPSDLALATLRLLTKPAFDLEGLVENARSLRERTQIRMIIEEQFENPSDTLVRFLVERVHTGRFTQPVLDHYRSFVQKALSDVVAARVDTRLKVALASNSSSVIEELVEIETPAPTTAATTTEAEESPEPDADEIVTTMDEIAALYIVKAILQPLVDPARVTPRDVRSYFGVLLDNNNRKPICRLWFNSGRKYLGVFDADKREERIPVERPEDLFNHAERIRESLNHVLNPGPPAASATTG